MYVLKISMASLNQKALNDIADAINNDFFRLTSHFQYITNTFSINNFNQF